ncbi:hypothetical protein MtrunA17_Chr3g0096711 [Medicago truncatula]|uniref:Transmembrane protein n=1 Tax=Medicago truncatula TaxID=3880 RepID=A0A396IQX2_MEDTR|nr:hypothetical protein MtrunA17_Chr3g0096711 [Medicago truncatula]
MKLEIFQSWKMKVGHLIIVVLVMISSINVPKYVFQFLTRKDEELF